MKKKILHTTATSRSIKITLQNGEYVFVTETTEKTIYEPCSLRYLPIDPADTSHLLSCPPSEETILEAKKMSDGKDGESEVRLTPIDHVRICGYADTPVERAYLDRIQFLKSITAVG